jgi:TolB-like protein/cytochrome c-type biogenesis protein CcmH/NrfG
VQPKTPPSVASLQGGPIPVHHLSPRLPDFELIRLIGRGSYGDVWLARGVTGIYRAIKVVWRDRFPEAGPYEREFKGLKSFAAISMNSQVRLALLHIGRNDEAGFFYYVMELADDVERGREIDPATYAPLTLLELRAKHGRLPAADCARFGTELARELACLHERGLVHRDIKLSNVIIVAGMPKLADIGLVAPASNTLTYVGTEGFVPPEGPGRPGADVFALGKLLYELSTGLDRQEFPQLPPNLLKLPDCDTLMALNGVILRACEPLAEKRYVDAGEMLADLTAVFAGRELLQQRQRRFRAWLVLVIVIAGIAAAVWWMFLRVPDAPPASPPPPPVATSAPAVLPVGLPSKSIAVLPFANFSDEKEANAFFSDGVHEDLLSNLGLIRDLRVVSRTSVMQYRSTTKPIGQIGRELGVGYVVEGSVRRLGNKVRVTTQLIDVRTDTHLWAETFDRDLTDIFAIQSEIAQAIATALQTTLSSGETSLLARRPTSNPAAYDLYLQARALRNSTVFSHQDYEALLKSAIRLDPKFAAAWAALGSDLAFQYFDDKDHTTDQLAAAKEAVETAGRLAPDDPEVVEGLGDYYYYGYRDYARATEQYLRLLRLRPNDAAMHLSLGLIQRRQGRWEDSLAEIRQALLLDPPNRRTALILIETLTAVNRYEEAEKLARQVVHDHPRDVIPASYLAKVTFMARGSTVEKVELERGSFDPAQADQLAVALRDRATETGDWAGYLRMIREQRYVPLGGPRWTQDIDVAVILTDTGDVPAARAEIDAVLPQMRAEVEHQPENVTLWACLALAHALKGDKDEALQCAEKVVAFRPEGRDALDAPQALLFRASIWARVGETDRALAELARLLRVPHGANVHFTRAGLFQGATFQPLRGNPRFEALLNDPRANAPITPDEPPLTTPPPPPATPATDN